MREIPAQEKWDLSQIKQKYQDLTDFKSYGMGVCNTNWLDRSIFKLQWKGAIFLLREEKGDL